MLRFELNSLRVMIGLAFTVATAAACFGQSQAPQASQLELTVRQHLRLGPDSATAVRAAEQLLSIQKQQYGEVSNEVAAALDLAKDAYYAAEDSAGMVAALNEQIDILKKLYGEDCWQAYGPIVDRYLLQVLLQKPRETRIEFTNLQNGKLDAVKSAINAGRLAEARLQIDSAKNWIVALLRDQSVPGDRMPIFATYLQQEAKLLVAENKLQHALQLQRQAVSVMLGSLSGTAPRLVEFYEYLGQLLELSGDSEGAEFEYRRAVDCAKATFQSPVREKEMLLRLVNLFSNTGRHGDAIAVAKELQTFARSPACPQATAIDLLQAYGRSLQSGRRPQEALALYEETKLLLEKSRETDSPRYVASLYGIGHAYFDLGKHEEALKRYQQVLGLVQKKPNGSDLLLAHLSVGKCQLAIGDLAATEASLRICESEHQKNPIAHASFAVLIGELRSRYNAATLDQLYDDGSFDKIREVLDAQLKQYEKYGMATSYRAMMARLERDALDELSAISQLEYHNWLVARRTAKSIATGTMSAKEIVSAAPPAIETIVRLVGDDDHSLPTLRYRWAMALRETGDVRGAERELRLSANGWDAQWPNEHPHPQQIQAWYELGRLLYGQPGRIAESVTVSLKAASLARALEGDRQQLDGSNASQLLADILRVLSNAQRWSNQLDAAIATSQELFELSKRLHGPKAGRTSQIRQQLAELMALRGRFDEAMSEYEALIALHQELQRPEVEKASILRGLGSCLIAKGDLQKGEYCLRDAIRLHESRPPSADVVWDLGRGYRDLGNVCLRTNRFDESLACYEKCYDIWTKAKIEQSLLDSVRTDLADLHSGAAYRLQLAGKPERAVTEREAARSFLVQIHGDQSPLVRLCDAWIKSHTAQSQLAQEDHEKVLSALNSYERLPQLIKEGSYDEVCQSASASIKTIESLLGPDDPFLLMVKQEHAAALFKLRRMPECIEVTNQVIALNAKLKGGDDAVTGKMLGTQATAFWDSGHLREATQRFMEQRRLYGSLRPFSSLDYGTASLRYAECRLEEDSLVEANEAIQAARDSLRNWASTGHVNRYLEAVVLSYRLAGRMGDRELAELYLREVTELLDQRNLRGSITEQLLLSAQCQQAMAYGQLQLADEASKRWLELATKSIPTAEPAYGKVLRVRSSALCQQGKWVEAHELCRRALEIAQKTEGTELADEARSLILLAEIDAGLGKLDEAQELAKQAVAQFSEALPPSHSSIVSAREQLARISLVLGDARGAEAARRENVKQAGEAFERVASIGNEDQLIALSQSMRQPLFAYLSIPSHLQDNEFVYQEVLRWKGAAFVKRKSLRELMADPQNAELVRAWQQAGSDLATEALRPPFAEGRAAWLQRLSRLRIEFGALDSRMSKLSQPAPTVTLRDLQASLPENSVLVDIVAYPHTSPPSKPSDPWTIEQRFAVFVVQREQPLKRVEISTASQVTEWIEQWRTLVKDAAGLSAEECLNENLPKLREVGSKLRLHVWEPLEAESQSASVVIVAPDGPLTSLPFAALPGADPQKFIVEDKVFVTIPAARLLVDSKPRSKGDPTLMVMGQVDYGDSPGPAAPTDKASIGGFTPLTLDHLECDAVEASFRKAFPTARCEYVIKGAPTEERFRQTANGFRWLHISTHGFFQESFAADALRRRESTSLPGLESSSTMDSEYGLGTLAHPSLQCGIGLAGANVANKPGQDDGILTAREVSLLNLSSVDGIVLSACQTALGTIKDGEGVLGLQRAFHQAGVRSVMATLWSVPVDATIGLLDVYYQIQWEDRLRPAYALQETQSGFVRQARLAEPDSLPAYFEHPYYWAGFSLSTEQP